MLAMLSQRCLWDILEEWSSVKLILSLELKTEAHAIDKYLIDILADTLGMGIYSERRLSGMQTES